MDHHGWGCLHKNLHWRRWWETTNEVLRSFIEVILLSFLFCLAFELPPLAKPPTMVRIVPRTWSRFWGCSCSCVGCSVEARGGDIVSDGVMFLFPFLDYLLRSLNLFLTISRILILCQIYCFAQNNLKHVTEEIGSHTL